MTGAEIDTTATALEWLKGGGLLAFAAAVLMELRAQRVERNDANVKQAARDGVITSILMEQRSWLMVLLDRAGVRVSAKRAPTTPTGVPVVDDTQE